MKNVMRVNATIFGKQVEIFSFFIFWGIFFNYTYTKDLTIYYEIFFDAQKLIKILKVHEKS